MPAREDSVMAKATATKRLAGLVLLCAALLSFQWGAAGQATSGSLEASLLSSATSQALSGLEVSPELDFTDVGDIPSPLQLAQAEISPPDNETWIDGPFELQYRVRMDEQAPPGVDFRSLPPLLHVDFRHQGDRKLFINMHQSSNHSLLINGVRYRRKDQPWGAGTEVPRGGEVLTLPFLLTPEWLEAEEGATNSLEIKPGGRYLVSIQLEFLERYEEEVRPGVPKGSNWRPVSTRTRVIEPLPLVVNDEAVLKEMLRRQLAVFPRCSSPRVQESLRKLVVENRPASVEYLLTQIGPGDDMLPDPASVIFANCWTKFTRDQLQRYLAASMSHRVSHRAEYPQGINALISAGPHFNTGYQGIPREPALRSQAKTITTHFVDGRLVGKPVKYSGHSSVSYNFPTGELALGKHSLSLVTEYEFLVGSELYSGKFETPGVEINIVPDAGDTLVAPVDAAVQQQIQQNMKFVDTRPMGGPQRGNGQPQGQQDHRDLTAQLRYSSGMGVWCPRWQFDSPAPVDLCFKVEFRIENSDAVIHCYPLQILRGKLSRGYFGPVNYAEEFYQPYVDAQGFVKGRFVLIPSRELALSDTRVTRYFGESLISELLSYRVGRIDQKPVEKDGQLPGEW